MQLFRCVQIRSKIIAGAHLFGQRSKRKNKAKKKKKSHLISNYYYLDCRKLPWVIVTCNYHYNIHTMYLPPIYRMHIEDM